MIHLLFKNQQIVWFGENKKTTVFPQSLKLVEGFGPSTC